MTHWAVPIVPASLALVAVLGLGQAGAQKPLVIETAETHEFSGSLRERFTSSVLVAKVRIDGARLVPAPDESPTIATDYECRVLEVFRGNAVTGSHLMVRREGGLREEPTRWRRLAIKGFPDFVEGDDYILFLQPAFVEGFFNVDPGGVYKVEEGVIRAFGKSRSAMALDAMPESWLIAELRKMGG